MRLITVPCIATPDLSVGLVFHVPFSSRAEVAPLFAAQYMQLEGLRAGGGQGG